MAKKILIVEDDVYLRDVYVETLKDAGYEVVVAFDGEEGYSLLQKGGYVLCLLDMMLPKLDGLGVLKKIKENPPAEPNGPMIVLSNLSHEPLIEEAKANGATTYIVKAENTPEMLLTQVKNLIG